MSDQTKGFWYILLGLTGLGSIVDGFTTLITLLYLFQEANALAYVFAVLSSLFVWLLTANFKAIAFGNSLPGIRIIAWIALGIDILTAYIGTTYYVALGYQFGAPINWDRVQCCDWSNLGRTLAAFGIGISFNLSTVYITDIWDKIRGP